MTITNCTDAARAFANLTKYPEQEELFVMSLNSANNVKEIHFVGLGSDTAVVISPKIIARLAVVDLAASVIICHTHPSGNPRPSKADVEQTEKLRKALQLFDIDLLDHVILTSNNTFYSFSDDSTYSL